MATIKPRAGKYTVQIRKKGLKSINATFARLGDAEAWARRVEGELERGEWHDNAGQEGTTLADVLRAYRDDRALDLRDCPPEVAKIIKEWAEEVKECKKQSRPPPEAPEETTPTRERIDAILRRWPSAEKIAMANLRQQEINDYIARRRSVVSNSTIDREIDLISTAINRAIAAGLHVDNPVSKIDRPRYKNERDRRLEEGEMGALMQALRYRTASDDEAQRSGGTRNPWMRWLVRWSIETAIRRGESLKLTWPMLKEKKLRIELPGEITKTGVPRNVPLSERAMRCLTVLRTMREDGEPRIFPTTEYAVKKAWERACARAGIEDLHFHDLRHEATSRLAETFGMEETMAITGHEDTRSMLRYYHPDATKLAEKMRAKRLAKKFE